jgi:hypothetical protein
MAERELKRWEIEALRLHDRGERDERGIARALTFCASTKEDR